MSKMAGAQARLERVVQRRLDALRRVSGVRESKVAMLDRALSIQNPRPALVAAALYGIGHCDGGDAVVYAVSGNHADCRKSMLASLSACAWAAMLSSEALRQLRDRNARVTIGDELTDVAMTTAGVLCTTGNGGYRSAALAVMQDLSRSLSAGVKTWTKNPIFNFVLWMIDSSMRNVERRGALGAFTCIVDAWDDSTETEFRKSVESAIDAHFLLCEYSASREFRIAYSPFDAMPLEVLAAVRVRAAERSGALEGSFVGLKYAEIALPVDAAIVESDPVLRVRNALQRCTPVQIPAIRSAESR